MNLEAGDVVLVPFPFTDLSARRTRPALVLSRGDYNDSGRDVLLSGMTSNLVNASHSVLVEQGDMAEGELRATSRVKVDKLVTLQQDLVRRRVGRVRPEVVARVLRELLTILPPADR